MRAKTPVNLLYIVNILVYEDPRILRAERLAPEPRIADIQVLDSVSRADENNIQTRTCHNHSGTVLVSVKPLRHFPGIGNFAEGADRYGITT